MGLQPSMPLPDLQRGVCMCVCGSVCRMFGSCSENEQSSGDEAAGCVYHHVFLRGWPCVFMASLSFTS